MSREVCGVVDGRAGAACLFDAGWCPLHGPGTPGTRSDGGASPGLPAGLRQRAGDGPFDARKLAHAAMNAVSRGEASPGVALRFVRVLESLHRLGPADEDREQALVESVVIGSVMNGIAPATPGQWRVAEEIYDPATLDALRHCYPTAAQDRDANLEFHTFPLPDSWGCDDVETWGNRAVGFDATVHGEQPTPPLPSLEYCYHALPGHIARMAAEQGTKLRTREPWERAESEGPQ